MNFHELSKIIFFKLNIYDHSWTLMVIRYRRIFSRLGKAQINLALLSLLQDFMLENPSVKDAPKSFKSFNPCLYHLS